MRLRASFALATLLIALVAVAVASSSSDTTVLPAKVSQKDAAGMIFSREGMSETTHADGHKTQNVTTLMSTTGKFASGMYSSTKTRIEVKDAYGVDEFMFFVEGGITLTSSDGSKMKVSAGEAVTIPKEWTGVFETDGYRKFWVIFDDTGKALQ